MAKVEIEVDDATLVVVLKELKYRMDGGYGKNDALGYAVNRLIGEINTAFSTKRDQVQREIFLQLEAVYDNAKGTNAQTGAK